MDTPVQYNNNKRPWSSGMTVASQASNPGSIPGGRICLLSLPRNTIPEHQKDAQGFGISVGAIAFCVDIQIRVSKRDEHAVTALLLFIKPFGQYLIFQQQPYTLQMIWIQE